jgi:Family of unknown function (DUF6183)
VNEQLRDLIEAQDLNGLLRAVDGLCSARAWDDLVELADECEEALDRGKQLWPIATHIDYRLALEAPADYAADVLTTDPKRFTLGPLTEVAASTHTWEELAPHIDTPQIAAYVAQERVLRGENLVGDERAHADVLEMPLELFDWEPTYPLATYKPSVVEVPEPWTPKAPQGRANREPAPEIQDNALSEGLLELVQPWTTESNGAARSVVVEGDEVGAASHLVLEKLFIGELQPVEAIQRLAWAAASGGAHGRRRGAAFGRFLAWYTVALVAELNWPVEPNDLAEAASELRWHLFDEGEEEEGWSLRLTVGDMEDGWTAAIAATDLLEEEGD